MTEECWSKPVNVASSTFQKRQQQKNLSADDLSCLLDDERKAEAESNPDLMRMVSGLLDQNDDGSFMDDVQNMAGKPFNRRGN